MSQLEKTLLKNSFVLLGIGVPILQKIGSFLERKSQEILYEKKPDSCKEMQAIINQMAQDYHSLAMRNDLLENENSELRRKISTWSEFGLENHDTNIKLVEKSKENARLLEQQKNMKLEIKNQEKTIESLQREINIKYEIIIQEAENTIFDLREQIEEQKIQLDENKTLYSDLEKDFRERKGIRLLYFYGNRQLITVTSFRIFTTIFLKLEEKSAIFQSKSKSCEKVIENVFFSASRSFF